MVGAPEEDAPQKGSIAILAVIAATLATDVCLARCAVKRWLSNHLGIYRAIYCDMLISSLQKELVTMYKVKISQKNELVN